MSRQGIRINDWFSQICIGIFFICIGMIFLSLFLSADVNAITEDLVGFIILTLIPTVFMDLGLMLAIQGWKGRRNASTINHLNITSADGGVASGEQKTIQAISKGMSTAFVIYIWAQRFISAVAAVIALLITAIWWLLSILDVASGKASLNGGLLLVLGIVLIGYIVIIYFMLLKKPRASPNAP